MPVAGSPSALAAEGGPHDVASMLPRPHWLLCILIPGCLLAGFALSGCALRATTDSGAGSDEPAHRSVGAGAGPFHDLLDSNRGVKNDPAGDEPH